MASKETTARTRLPQIDLAAGDLVAACRAGDRAAQERLYEVTHLRVYRLMIRMVGLQDAADVTQQVYLQLFRKVDQFRGKSKFETWLYRLATNEALQHLRKGKRWNFQPLAVEPTQDESSVRKDPINKELLEQALAKVDPELRAIFVLREVEGLSYREIAEVVAIPEGTVGSRLNRVRRELQEHLIGLGWEP